MNGQNWLMIILGDGRMFSDYLNNLKTTMEKKMNGINRVENGDVKNLN